jgi:NitT/TauT family transport system substrate-binding protein
METLTLQGPFRAVFYAPFYAALARGAYATEGVEVRLLDGSVPHRAAEAAQSGAADLAWGGPMRVLLAHDRDPGCPLRNFGAVVMGDPFLLVGRAPNPGFRLHDLASMTLGTVSEVPTPWWTLQDDIRRSGLDPGSLRRVTGRTMAENAAAVAEGRLDVAQLLEPFVSTLEAASTGHVWHAAAARGPTAYTTFVATAARIAERRRAFIGLIRGMAATQRWLAQAGSEEIAATIAGFFPDLAPALLARCVARYKELGIWSADPRYPREAFERLQAAMLSAGAIRRAPGFAACTETALVEAALAGRAAA